MRHESLYPRRPRTRARGHGLQAVLWALVPLLLAGCGGGALAAKQGDVAVKAVVEKDDVSLGEPFAFQIQVEGADMKPGAPAPDLTGVKDFTVEYLGAQSNNRSSITIINGQVKKEAHTGYVHSYRLTPKRSGNLVIPAIDVSLEPGGSMVVKTQPITVRAVPAESTDDFHLEVRFARSRYYVGEPMVVTLTWYLARDVENVTFNLPFMENGAFTLTDPRTDQDPAKQYYQIPVGQGSVTAEKGHGMRNGREYTTLSFKKVIFAREPGVYDIPEATVSCRAVVGYSKPQSSRHPFDSFFNDDFFNMGRKQVFKTFVARSEPVSLSVLALPEEGKPATFSGCVGSYRIETGASPTDVSVGDPITLTVEVSGADYVDNFELPPLSRDPDLERDFKIPEEISPGVVRNGSKVFTQTLRAKGDHVKAIPPLSLACFDPEQGQYRVARSNPIPIEVKPTRIVTEADVEGRAAGPVKSELEAWSQGIAHNYEGPDLLVSRRFRLAAVFKSFLWLGVLLLHICLAFMLFIWVRLRERDLADPDRARSRKALAAFKQASREMSAGSAGDVEICVKLLDAMRSYLGDKLGTKGAALTFADIELRLKEKGVDDTIIQGLADLFAVCEAGRYGGRGSARPAGDLVQKAIETAHALDRHLK